MKVLLYILLISSVSCSPRATSVTPQQLSGQSSAKDEVVASLKKWTTIKSFRQRFTSTAGGTETSGTMEFLAPDRVHLVMNIAGEPFESITIGQTEYAKDVDGRWVKTVLDGPATASAQGHLFTNPKHLAQLAENVTEAQLINTESIEGILMKQFKFKHRLPHSAGTYESQMWVAVSDGLPRRIETVYNFGGSGSGKSSIVCSDYNAAITIESPIQ